MERSRCPTRSSLGNELRPLVGFPVWTRPMGSGTPAPPPRQYPNHFPWSQQGHGASTTQEVPLSQQSMMIPPGQPGLSQQAVDLSQRSATPVSSWQPPRAPMTTPRPAVQGCGMAGMMHQFPPPPPSWGEQTADSGMATTFSVWPEHTYTTKNSFTTWLGVCIYKNTVYWMQKGFQLSNLANIGSQMKSSMTTKKSMDYLFLELFEAPAGAS